MKIAVDTRHFGNTHLDTYGYFLYEVLKRVVLKNPGFQFIFISDRINNNTKFSFTQNVTSIISGPRTTNFFTEKIWYDVRIPALLRKYEVDIFITGNRRCSLTAKNRQCIVLTDLSFQQPNSFFKGIDSFFLKRYTKKFLQRANRIVTTSEYLKKRILSRYAIDEAKISTVIPGPKNIFSPLADSEKEEVRKKYSDGKNYFIYAQAIHSKNNLVTLLKAFSIFKKRQKTDWKLVLAGGKASNYKDFSETLKTYKYRTDVVIAGQPVDEDLAKLLTSSYAFIYPSISEGSGMDILGPMNNNIPVITSANSAMYEIAGDAALYVDPDDYKDIADKMMLLYKDEWLRSSLIEKGKIVAARYNWEKTADLFWESILKAMK